MAIFRIESELALTIARRYAEEYIPVAELAQTYHVSEYAVIHAVRWHRPGAVRSDCHLINPRFTTGRDTQL